MEKLIELGISPKLAEILSDDGWTPDKIATAGIKALTKYKGVGRQTAFKWIRAARLQINQRELNAGLAMEREEGFHRNAPVRPRAEPPGVSVRVKRIQEANQ